MSEYTAPDTHPDQLTLQQMEDINEEIANSQPLISETKEVNVLAESYANSTSPGFLPGIQYLSQRFSCMRKVRGDGNCFYRSVLFGYLENLLKLHLSGNEASVQVAKSEYERILSIIRGSFQELVSMGYPEYALESFHEVIGLRCD
jgi:ubiquitin thioesterase protein OTUB1